MGARIMTEKQALALFKEMGDLCGYEVTDDE